MSIVNRVVDKVYIINMDRDQERMKKAHTALVANSIEYKRFSAIVGAKVETSKYLTNQCNSICTDGIKGCALSHRAIWEDMILNSYQSILVLEDDIQITPDFNERFKTAWDAVPKDFDILFVGCKFICNDTRVGTFLTSTGLSIKHEKVNEDINRTYGSVGTHAYIITRKTAEKFLGKKIHWHIDYQIQTWIKEDSLKSYAMSSLPIETNEEANRTSALSEKYPILLNSLLDKIPLSDTDTVSWILGENHYKIFGQNWNALSVILMVGMLLTPIRYLWIWILWTILEFAVSLDTKNTTKILSMLIVAYVTRFALERPKKLRFF